MENIYHDYWEQELMYQFLTEDKCKKKAYVCSPFSADDKEGMLQNMRTARAYMFYAMKKMNMSARAPHAYLPMLVCDKVPMLAISKYTNLVCVMRFMKSFTICLIVRSFFLP